MPNKMRLGQRMEKDLSTSSDDSASAVGQSQVTANHNEPSTNPSPTQMVDSAENDKCDTEADQSLQRDDYRDMAMIPVSNKYDALEAASCQESPLDQDGVQPLQSKPHPRACTVTHKATAAASCATTCQNSALPTSLASELSPESRRWLNKFNLRLACSYCYKGGNCIELERGHRCPGKLLICQLDRESKNGKVWGVIRQITNPQRDGYYQLCRSQCSREDCRFCHSEEEMNIWSAERGGHFNREEISSHLRSVQHIQQKRSRPYPEFDDQGFQKVTNCQRSRHGSFTVHDSQKESSNTKIQESSDLPKSANQRRKKVPPLIISHADRQAHKSLMSKVGGHFLYLCETCFDSAPPVMCEKPDDGQQYCTNDKVKHLWNQVLVHYLLEEGRHGYLKIRQRPKNTSQNCSLCRHIVKHFGCWRGDSCGFAHNKVEIEVWKCEAEFHVSQNALAHLCRETYIPQFPHRLMYTPDQDDVVLLSEETNEWYIIRGRHARLRPDSVPVLCRPGVHCRHRNATCTHPHIPEEADLWSYMAEHNLKTLDEVMSVACAADDRRSGAEPTSQSPPQPLVSKPQIEPYPCTYCNRHFPQRSLLEDHLQTLDHRTCVNSDQGKIWKHREPPWNIVDGNYELCQGVEGGTCLFSASSGNESTCTKAHSDEELQEWKDRHKYRIAKIKAAKNKNLYAYMSKLLSLHKDGMNVFKDNLPGVSVECSEELNQCLETEMNPESGVPTFTWQFVIETTNKQKPLEHVGLLFPEEHTNFSLSHPETGARINVCPGNLLSRGNKYHVCVVFESQVLGTFSQWLVFYFGSEPVLVRKLEIDVGSGDMHITDMQHALHIESWNSDNSSIVKFRDETGQSSITEAEREVNEELLRKYSLPSQRGKDDGLINDKLGRENYKSIMHRVLYMEEKECNKKISRFATSSTLKVTSEVELLHGTEYAQGGHMFASVNLEQALVDDSAASQIVVKTVQNMLLKFDSSSRKVYEAAILPNQTFGKKTQDVVYMKLSKECVTDHGLSVGSVRDVTVQLQLDRTQFCYKHFSVDQLQNMDMVFPRRQRNNVLLCDADAKTTNIHQEKMITYISSYGGEAPPMSGVGPVLMCGPFGTGKTYTLAMGAMEALRKHPTSKVLITAHSNSAADCFITNYLDKFVRETKLRMIRMYATYRNPSSINPVVRDYVPKDRNGNIQLPTMETIRECQIVVTTLTTAINLVALDSLRGFFTHILIDEAGQVLESEALMPLALATDDTCVVLTGDHKQMSPKIFSEAVRTAGYDKSLLERLFQTGACRTLLSSNYRTCQPILDFISESYYHSQPFRAVIEQPLHPTFYPLMFYEVKGTDQHVGKSYVNNHEVLEVVRRTKELHQNWPKDWGTFNESSIGIVSTYIMQVHQIRSSLKKEGLGRVTVETVENVQGKQFRVIIISTVRTRKTLQGSAPTTHHAQEAGQDWEFCCGLLSDPKMLNTALTRTQSLCVVVGDPVALCSMGSCSTKWRHYLKLCEHNRSLFPLGTTLETIHEGIRVACHRLNPDAVPFKPAHQQTNQPTTKMTHPQRRGGLGEGRTIAAHRDANSHDSHSDDQASHSDADSWFTDDDDDSDNEDDILKELRRQIEEDKGIIMQAQGPKVHMKGQAHLAPEQENATMEDILQAQGPDESIAKVHMKGQAHEVSEQENAAMVDILQAQEPESIAKVHMKRPFSEAHGPDQFQFSRGTEENQTFEPQETQTDEAGSLLDNYQHPMSGGTPYRKQRLTSPERKQSKKQKKKQSSENLFEIKMKPSASSSLKGNVKMVKFGNQILLLKDTYDRSKLEGANNVDEDDSYDRNQQEDLKMMNEETCFECRQLVESEPEKFKICSFMFETSSYTYAIAKGENAFQRIWISGKKRRGQALHMDEVVVEILQDDEDLESDDAHKERKTYGKVLCILKRSTNPYSMNIVCTLDRYSDNLMVPLSHTFPKMYVFSHKRQKKDNNRGMDKPNKPQHHVSADFVPVSVFKKKTGSRKRFAFDKIVEVPRSERLNKLFVVQYLEWSEDNRYPLCYVSEELPAGTTIDNGLLILKYANDVRDAFPHSVIREAKERFGPEWRISDEELESRKDLRSTFTFTVDNPETQDLDDALSIEMQDEQFLVGIHIANVAHFIPKDSLLDIEAKERAVSFYPAFSEPIDMLPKQLTTDRCSLFPGQDRLAISVFVSMDENGSISKPATVELSVIHSKKRLTYMEVEEMIKAPGQGEMVGDKVRQLSQLAQKRRRHRLKDGCLAFSHGSEEVELVHPLGHSMVEEMMLIANEEAAKLLESKCPGSAPLRSQLAPDSGKLESWRNVHKHDIPNSLFLQSVPAVGGDAQVNAEQDVYILKDKMERLLDVISSPDNESNKMSTITDIICSDENHPQLAVARSDLNNLQERATYINSVDQQDRQKRGHYNLKMASYCHFTSPIRRFIDIVVQRLIIAALANPAATSLHPGAVYSEEELSWICHHCTNQGIKAKKFQKETESFHFALKLREAPQSITTFVDGVTEGDINVLFPYRHFISRKTQCVPLQLLSPAKKPAFRDGSEVKLEWMLRIYNVNAEPKTQTRTADVLDTEQFVIKISAVDWKGLLTAIKRKNFHSFQVILKRANSNHIRSQVDRQQLLATPGKKCPVTEISSEAVDNNGNHAIFCKFSRDFKSSDVLQVQLCASVFRGLLIPSIQLVSLTPNLGVCTEHRASAVESFNMVALKRVVKCSSLQEYKDIWLPILEMMSVHNAFRSKESIFIHEVIINWNDADSTGEMSGMFHLTRSFCEERHIRLNLPHISGDKDDFHDDEEEHNPDVNHDYLCIRYNMDMPLETKAALQELNSKKRNYQPNSDPPGEIVVVLHAVVTDITSYKGNLTVHIRVKKLNSPFPKILLDSGERFPCTIELTHKQEQDRRLENAVANVDKATPMIKEICLSQHKGLISDALPQDRRMGAAMVDSFMKGNPQFVQLNESQQTALVAALQQPFTAIQGPPGTGKTIVGAALAYLFTETNKALLLPGRKQPQVLYCGPSNESVNVAAGYLKQLDVKAVRVYSETIERQDYPVPGDPCMFGRHSSRKDNKKDASLDAIALHHLIRKSSNSHSKKIQEFDTCFNRPNYKPSVEDIKAFKKEISKAEEEELRRFQIILCTCNASGSWRITQRINVQQCIIDEAGMCSEPETLIPLVGTSPMKIVLIGDHKQLRPIITEPRAEQLDVKISLLEKHEANALMLTTQYRMHDSICRFPSTAFYNDRLETAEVVRERPAQARASEIWPGGPEFRNVFCHVSSKEETLTVSADEGNEMSKANPEQVKHVIRIATTLVDKYKTAPENILVLSQYRLQCAQIREELTKHPNLKKITVSTVIKSQGGERDFVILSTVRSLPRIEIEERPTLGWQNHNLGFILDENQMNVAITRAKEGLIIIGNQHLLQVHKKWQELISDYRDNRAVVHASSFLRCRRPFHQWK